MLNICVPGTFILRSLEYHEQTALLIRPPDVAQSGNVNNVRVFWIDRPMTEEAEVQGSTLDTDLLKSAISTDSRAATLRVTPLRLGLP